IEARAGGASSVNGRGARTSPSEASICCIPRSSSSSERIAASAVSSASTAACSSGDSYETRHADRRSSGGACGRRPYSTSCRCLVIASSPPLFVTTGGPRKCPPGAQHVAQASPGAAQAGLDGAERQPGDPGDLVVGEPVHVREHDDLAPV